MHVTFYRCFDRLLGSWIINEFLKIIINNTIIVSTIIIVIIIVIIVVIIIIIIIIIILFGAYVISLIKINLVDPLFVWIKCKLIQGIPFILQVTEYSVVKCDNHRFFSAINTVNIYTQKELFCSQLNYHRELTLMTCTGTFAKGMLCESWYWVRKLLGFDGIGLSQDYISQCYVVYFCSCTFTYVYMYVCMAGTTAEGQNLLMANISTSRASLLQGQCLST